MSGILFFEEMDMLLDGLVNGPKIIINHLLTQEGATLEELQNLVDEESKRYVEGWIRRMTTKLAVVRFISGPDLEESYELTPFAKDMITHIDNFKKPIRTQDKWIPISIK